MSTPTTTNSMGDKAVSVRLDERAEDFDGYQDWSPNDVAEFFKKNNLGDYSEAFQHHKVSGRLLPLLTDQDLRDIGIEIVGDKLRIKALIKTLGIKHRYTKRTKIWWEGTEQLYYSNCEKNFWTCCGCFPDDPSTYKLTGNHLKVKTDNPYRCLKF